MIEVLKQMVEALEWCHGGEPVGTAEAIQAGKKLIAELESQEPDVVMHWHSHTWTTINPPPKNSGDVNLYYATLQRTWQGLTDEETSGFTQHEMSVVKYVNKVLQEKNT